MTFLKVAGTAAVLFFGMTISVYAQKEGKEESQEHPAKPEQHAAPAKAPAQQSQQRQAQPAKAPPQQHTQQAQAPAKQQQQHAEQAKPSPTQQSPHTQQANAPAQQHVPQAKAPAQQSPQRAQVDQKQPQHAQQAKAAVQQSPQRAPVNQQQPPHTQQQAQSWQKQRGWASSGGSWQPHTSFQQGRDQNWASDHRDWSQRGGYGGSYIPQATFGLYFGSAHFFHIGIMPVMYLGYPRFAYSGFSFMLVDPWPSAWQENWYASDDVFIDYDGGYYLHDRQYPGVRLAITVAL